MKRKKQNEVLDVLDYSEPITKIYFVRHGQTKANKEGLLIGQWDIPLNDTGKQQAKNAGLILKNKTEIKKIDCIIASPLIRTMQTAKSISQITGVKKIITNNDIMERDEGDWEKKSYWEVRDTDPKKYYKWLSDPFNIRPPKGESVADLKKRVLKFEKYVLNNFKGKNIIVVSHSGPIRMFLLNILECALEKYWFLKVENGSVSEVHLSKTHKLIWAMNRMY